MTTEKTPGIGDNSAKAAGTTSDAIRSYVKRIENVQCEIDELKDDQKEIYTEAKANSFDTKVLRKLIARRRRDAAEVAEEEALLDLYLSALGVMD